MIDDIPSIMDHLIDVHTHLYPRDYLEALSRRTEPPYVRKDSADLWTFRIFPDDPGRPVVDSYWSVDEKVAFMDRHGITTSIVSLGNPWLDPFEGDEALALAQTLNAWFASLETRTNGRVLGMGCLPSNATVAEIVQVIRDIEATPGLHGVVIGTRLLGLPFDSLELEPIWTALGESDVPVLVHPHYGVGVSEMDGYGHSLPLALGFPYETTLALTKLSMSGVLERHPGLKVIGSHGGGALPFLAGRLDGCWAPDEHARERHGNSPTTGFRNLYLDALVYHPRAIRAVVDLVGPEQVMFGTDHPFEIADPQANLAALREALAPEDQDHVLSKTAIELFHL